MTLKLLSIKNRPIRAEEVGLPINNISGKVEPERTKILSDGGGATVGACFSHCDVITFI